MAEPPSVLDTSVIVAWFFTDEPMRDKALAVRWDLRSDPMRYVVPPLVFSELVHVLGRKSDRDESFVTQALDLVLGLGLRTLQLPEAALRRTATWVCRGMSGYDATFVALAEAVGGRWLTADEPAARLAGESLAQPLRDFRPEE